jgi:hypothetical protein
MVTGKWPAKDESSRKQCSVHRCDDYLRAMTLTSLNPDFDDWPISSSFFFSFSIFIGSLKWNFSLFGQHLGICAHNI